MVSIFVTTSCNKYLEQAPITDVTTVEVFKNEENAFKALAGVYSRLTGDQGYGIRLSLYYTVDNDETQGPSGTNDDDRRGMSRYTLSASNGQLDRPFGQLFQGIEYANIFIDNVTQMDLYKNGSELEKKRLQRMLGEALTLRAQFYFEAVRNWGDLPLHFEPAYKQASQNPFPKRENRDLIYDRILADLATASNLVPWQNEVTSIGDKIDERITKAAVKALRARIALFAGGYSLRPINSTIGEMKRRSDYTQFYEIARKECSEIMSYGAHNLNPNFKNLWKEQVGKRVVVDPHGELLFQVTGIGGSSAADTKLGYYDGPGVANTGNRSVLILPTYFYLFDSTDTRRDVTVAPYNVNSDFATKTGTSITAMNQAKYRRDWSSFNSPTVLQWFGAKWQIIRYSDVLLMFAEAENELNGPTPLAYDAINQVRRRGYGKPMGTIDATIDIPSGLSKQDFFNALVKERSLEFGGEGIRKYDLIRWNLLATKISETKQKLLDMANRVPPYDNFPSSMFFFQNSTADDGSLWANSFYAPAPSSINGATRVNWIGTGIGSTNLGITMPTTNAFAGTRYASGFVSGKSELFPIPQAQITANFNLTQNPGY